MNKKLLSVTAIILVAVVVNFSNAQLSRYTFSCGTTTYTPISGTPGPSGDDATIQITLPFTFVYCNVSYTTISWCTNGWISPGTTNDATYVNALCSPPATAQNMIALFWDDLYPTGGANGTTTYTVQGSAPNRVWIGQYTAVAHFAGSPCCLNCQVRLYEGSGLIEFVYGSSTGAGWTGSIGLSEAPGGTNHVMSVTPGADCPSTTMSRTACNDAVDIPNLISGRLYRFSPAPQPNYFNTQWCPPANPFPNIPAATIYNASAWIGDTLYMHCPDGTGNAATTVRRYSLSGNAWTTGVSLPAAKTQGTLTSAGGKLYYIGGSATPGGAGTTDVYQYDPLTGAWTLRAPLPAGVNGHGAGNWGDSVIFVIMGPWGTPTTSCYFYRISTNTTGTTTSFPGLATRGHGCSIWGNKIYVAGGFGGAFTKQFYIGTIGSDASTISWSPGPPFPSVPKGYLGGVAVGDRFYLVGGNNSIGTTSSDSTMIWGVTCGCWSILQNQKPAAAHNIEAACTYKLIGDTAKIFCPGGSSGSGTTLNFDVIACGPIAVGIGTITSEIPRDFSLSQNYPNPFNPSTTIKFGLPRAGNVKLVVYDLLGKEVATLVNGVQHAGYYEIKFDGSSLASGVYLYRIETGDFIDVKKMLLIK